MLKLQKHLALTILIAIISQVALARLERIHRLAALTFCQPILSPQRLNASHQNIEGNF
jgi:hypothetical protein